MEILESLFARVTGTRAEWLRQVREGAPEVKAQEEAASQARLADMWAAEKRRREDLVQARAERDRQQRILVTVTVAIVVVVVVVILVALAIVTLRAPSPCIYPC
jgi:t-SNARE complex subunit (syntaxin)